jgi:hypothetical protein
MSFSKKSFENEVPHWATRISQRGNPFSYGMSFPEMQRRREQ